MAGRTASVVLLVVPAVGLAALDSRSSPAPERGRVRPVSAPPTTTPSGRPSPSCSAAALGWVVVRVGVERLLRAAPALFVVALIATAAVFVPGIGVRAAGASRWLRLGPLSGNPAPFLIGATGLLMAAWGGDGAAAGGGARWRFASRPLALALALLAVLVLVAQPDFSAAAVALCVTFAALAGAGVGGRRLVPAAVVLLIALAPRRLALRLRRRSRPRLPVARERPARPRLRGARPRARQGERRRRPGRPRARRPRAVTSPRPRATTCSRS